MGGKGGVFLHPYQTSFWNNLKTLQGWKSVKHQGHFFLVKRVVGLGCFAMAHFLDSADPTINSILASFVNHYSVHLLLLNPTCSWDFCVAGWVQKSMPMDLVYSDTYVLNIAQECEQIWKKFNSNYRNEIRQVEKEAAYTFEVNEKKWMDDFYALYEQRMEEEGQSKLSFEFVQSIFDQLGEHAMLFSCVPPGYERPSHYLLTIHSDHTALYLLGANRPAPGVLPGAGKALFWKAFQYYHQLGCSQFEFGGIILPPPNSRIASINDFKRRFGGELKTFPESLVLFKQGSIKSRLLWKLYLLHRRGGLKWIKKS